MIWVGELVDRGCGYFQVRFLSIGHPRHSSYKEMMEWIIDVLHILLQVHIHIQFSSDSTGLYSFFVGFYSLKYFKLVHPKIESYLEDKCEISL